MVSDHGHCSEREQISDVREKAPQQQKLTMGLSQGRSHPAPCHRGPMQARLHGHFAECCPGQVEGLNPRFWAQHAAQHREGGLHCSADPLSAHIANDLTSFTNRSKSRVSQEQHPF